MTKLSTKPKEEFFALLPPTIYFFYYTSGCTTIDGVKRNDRRENTRLGLTIALPVNQRNSIKLYASTAVSTTAGHSFDAIGIAWQYRWECRALE